MRCHLRFSKRYKIGRLLLYGPRQSGKTTLSKQIICETGLKTLSVNADQVKYVDVLSSRDLAKLRSLVDGYELLFIDEGQRIPDIGINLKILHEKHYKHVNPMRSNTERE